jgi:hypothetical protein
LGTTRCASYTHIGNSLIVLCCENDPPSYRMDIAAQ